MARPAFDNATFVFVFGEAKERAVDRDLLDVVAALVEKGAHVRLVCRPRWQLLAEARALGVDMVPYTPDRAHPLRTRSRLRRYLQRFAPAVAHASGPLAIVALEWAASPLPVCTAHTLDGPLPGGTTGAACRWALERSDHVFATTEAMEDLFALGLPHSRVTERGPERTSQEWVKTHLKVYAHLMRR